jgi:phenylacetate-CoA ligase
MDRPLTDEQRFPLLTEEGRRMLRWLQEHPRAPRYNHRCGDRLDAAALQRVRDYAAALDTAKRGWTREAPPDWLPEFTRFCLAEVPFYRRRGGDPDEFAALPTATREDLVREPWSFVPDSQPLEGLILYHSSGTTGERLTALSHPEVPARDLPLLQKLLRSRGVTLDGGPGRVSIVMACAQTRTISYPLVSSYLGEAGFVKVNLNPNDWRDPEDRVGFLDACDPELYSGDPIAFYELAKLPLQTRPKALVSTAMTLLPGFRRWLEERFGCPVFDLYAMNEAGIVSADGGAGHEILPPDLFVEILRPDGAPCEPGERGEVTLTGGGNPFLPLLRYRTCDWASMDLEGAVPRLVGLEGRAPVLFRNASGETVASSRVTAALQDLPLAAFTLCQEEEGKLVFRSQGELTSPEGLREALSGVFGRLEGVEIGEMASPYEWGGKMLQYASRREPTP